MSAFICSDKHIVTLVVGCNLLRYRPLPQEDLQQQADLLMRENIRSVNYRYHERTKIVPVTFDPADVALADHYSPADLVKLAECLDYQSCERPDYDKSKAFALNNELRVLAYEKQVELGLRRRENLWSI